jgi:hypothetical protein
MARWLADPRHLKDMLLASEHRIRRQHVARPATGRVRFVVLLSIEVRREDPPPRGMKGIRASRLQSISVIPPGDACAV